MLQNINWAKTAYFWSKLAIMTCLDAILDMKDYSNSKKPLNSVSLGTWHTTRIFGKYRFS